MTAVRSVAQQNILAKKEMDIAIATVIVKIQAGSDVVTISAQIKPIFQETYSQIIQRRISTAPRTTVVIVHATNDTTSVDTMKWVVSQTKTVRQDTSATETLRSPAVKI